MDMGDTAAGGVGGVVERWSVFGPRPLVQKSTSDLGSDPTAAGKQGRLAVRFKCEQKHRKVPLLLRSTLFS